MASLAQRLYNGAAPSLDAKLTRCRVDYRGLKAIAGEEEGVAVMWPQQFQCLDNFGWP